MSKDPALPPQVIVPADLKGDGEGQRRPLDSASVSGLDTTHE